MLDDIATAVATGAAGNIVAYMMSDQLDALRALIARVFRHGTEQEKSMALHALEDDSIAVREQEKSVTELTRQWEKILASYMDIHPESIIDVKVLASPLVGSNVNRIGSLRHEGTGSMYGGNHYGDNTYQGQ